MNIKRSILGFIILSFIVSTNLAFAASKKQLILCPLMYASKLKDKLPNKTTDKFKHCTLSCQLALRCSSIDTMNLGILKEVWDLFTPGNAEWNDIKADAIGISLAKSKRAMNDIECIRECKNIYE